MIGVNNNLWQRIVNFNLRNCKNCPYKMSDSEFEDITSQIYASKIKN